jgi:hypothetical protein
MLICSIKDGVRKDAWESLDDSFLCFHWPSHIYTTIDYLISSLQYLHRLQGLVNTMITKHLSASYTLSVHTTKANICKRMDEHEIYSSSSTQTIILFTRCGTSIRRRLSLSAMMKASSRDCDALSLGSQCVW